LHDWVAESDRAALEELLTAHAGQPDIEVSLRRRDGSPFAVRLSLVSASDDFITLLITEREDAQATLAAIHNGEVDAFVVGGEQVVMLEDGQVPYRLLVERMRQGAVTTSLEGEIVYANERFGAMVGVRPDRLLGRPLREVIFHADRPAFERMLAEKHGGQAELRLRSSTGHLPVTQASAAVLADKRLVLFMDITQQKRHAASDERTRKFLGTLAHEFRNILGPIVNSVELLKRSQLDADAGKAASMIERQTERLLALVEDLRRINPD
ncbi:MAG TPA: histidine kinase dimerization/phospho-acceptor domain-containing protein, partial [Burkholderiales bacterium]|nr:histidine kinase dimerization/phospho-acceptor domain-containing protein [Burkholderiales bacterium]